MFFDIIGVELLLISIVWSIMAGGKQSMCVASSGEVDQNEVKAFFLMNLCNLTIGHDKWTADVDLFHDLEDQCKRYHTGFVAALVHNQTDRRLRQQLALTKWSPRGHLTGL